MKILKAILSDCETTMEAIELAVRWKEPVTIRNQLGWEDTVVWSPFGDENMGYDSFVCVESAKASSPVVLGPSEYWTGAMDVVA